MNVNLRWICTIVMVMDLYAYIVTLFTAEPLEPEAPLVLALCAAWCLHGASLCACVCYVSCVHALGTLYSVVFDTHANTLKSTRPKTCTYIMPAMGMLFNSSQEWVPNVYVHSSCILLGTSCNVMISVSCMVVRAFHKLQISGDFHT